MIYHFTNSIFAFLVVAVEIKIAFIAAATDCAVPLESDAAHISVNAVVAQTKSRREFLCTRAVRNICYTDIAARLPDNAFYRIRFP